MPREVEPTILEQIKRHALGRLSATQAQQSNLSVNRRIFEAGEQIGPPTQRITVDEPTLVVFADDAPLANWGHPCRYLLYNPADGSFRGEIHARLPSGALEPFFQPVQLSPPAVPPTLPQLRWPTPWRCPVIIPDGNRYALLFAGFTMGRHLNDLEFCYRTLVNVYAVPPENIIVLSFDGTLSTVAYSWSGTVPPPAVWPGDGTPFQIVINGQGTLQGLQDAFAQLATLLAPNDLLFIHTNNHGDTDATGAFLGCGLPTRPQRGLVQSMDESVCEHLREHAPDSSGVSRADRGDGTMRLRRLRPRYSRGLHCRADLVCRGLRRRRFELCRNLSGSAVGCIRLPVDCRHGRRLSERLTACVEP